ncbi:hypothetical protein [Pseudoalteromonas piscicida]|uniref:hypothetical protein n=1 Tax=Pseudoalteromonas piscicida TaxID=43662 RepID=UPI0032C0C0B3
MFDDLMNDTVILLKQNGETVQNIKASVQKNRIYISRSDILIEPHDLIRRTTSNGAEEQFKVIDPGFHEGNGHIPAGYQAEVVKLGLPQHPASNQNITYNISGTNNRVNQSSSDQSVNIVNMDSEVFEHIMSLRNEVAKLKLPKDDEIAALEVIDEIEGQVSSGLAKKSIVRVLINSLPNAGSIASIGSLIVSLIG